MSFPEHLPPEFSYPSATREPAVTSMPSNAPASRRTVPTRLTEEQRDRLHFLLHDPDTWVLRPGWERFLLHGDHATLVRTDTLSSDHRAAALAWLRQQRHALHRALEGGEVAPDGWLESLPLVARLLELGAGVRLDGR